MKNNKDKTSFMKSFKAELKKVIWPSAKDVTTGTIAVTVISAIVGVYIMLVDAGSIKLVELITGLLSNV